MIGEGVAEELRRIIQTLRSSSRSGRQDRMRRLFQLQRWIVTNTPEEMLVLRGASAHFRGLSLTTAINSGIKRAREFREDAAPAAVIAKLIEEDDDFNAMLDAHFTSSRSISFLQPSLDEQTTPHKWTAKIKGTNRFTEYCLRLSEDQAKDVKGAAAALYAHYASEKQSGVPKEIEPERTARRNRLAFVYVASRHNQELLDVPDRPGPLWNYLIEKTNDRHRFDLFFSHCAFVQNVLAHGSQFTGDHIAEWAGVSPEKPPAITKLTSAEKQVLKRFAGDKRGGRPQER